MVTMRQLETVADFEALSKGDMVVCEWKRDSYKNGKRTRFASYDVIQNKALSTEIILQTKMNVYFNYKMYLDSASNGHSNLKSIAILTNS